MRPGSSRETSDGGGGSGSRAPVGERRQPGGGVDGGGGRGGGGATPEGGLAAVGNLGVGAGGVNGDTPVPAGVGGVEDELAGPGVGPRVHHALDGQLKLAPPQDGLRDRLDKGHQAGVDPEARES